ncbi:hypothetical protein HDIA_4246 [Hartmannibacter diazotrophicus]|uniref:Uncharacterized protein n=1 Tax=Hartmannibacter diazotrophicus TaxID=1482074 RepID=A0A2C9DBW1_9HYPH|nr:hypothetical protein [Hartmannibacter diazotrophicus]SON57787.1 hypothetical protein HDIA_4246 [Hartmannibacter diazotrophicus]
MSLSQTRGRQARRSSNGLFGPIVKIFDQLDAACACANAIRYGRRPDAASLKALGIDEHSFDSVHFGL